MTREAGDVYGASFEAWSRVAELVETDNLENKIYPDLRLRVANQGPRPIIPAGILLRQDKKARVIFYATKFEPAQMVHLLVIPYLLAAYKADKVIIMNDNSDPERKPDLLSLVLREPVAEETLKTFGSFVQSTSFQKEDQRLWRADGETVVRRFMRENNDIEMEVVYVAGLDHMRLQNKQGKSDTPVKIAETLNKKDRDTACKV